MATSAEMEISQVKLLNTDAAAVASESELEGAKTVLLTPSDRGGTPRRSRIVVVASLFLSAVGAAIFQGLGGSKSVPVVQQPEPITIPPYVHHENLPGVEELFEIAKGFHPDLDERLKKMMADHHVPDLLHNASADVTDPEAMLRKMQKEYENHHSTLRNLQITSCFIDTWQLIIQIGSIVTNIRAAEQACAEPYPENLNKRSVCASMVTLDMAMWMYMGTYICNMWSSCPGVFSKNATCALGPVGILSSSFTLANAGATMATNCKQGITTPAPPRDPKDRKIFDRLRSEEHELGGIQAFGGGRRLHSEKESAVGGAWAGSAGGAIGEFLKQSEEAAARQMRKSAQEKRAERQAARQEARQTKRGMWGKHTREGEVIEDEVETEEETEEEVTMLDRAIDAHSKVKEHFDKKNDERWAIATCVFDTQRIVARLMQAATFIGFAALDCREEVFQKQGHQAKDKCVIDIGIIVASLAIASNQIAISIINCPHHLKYMPNNLCAAGICNVISSAGYVAVAFAGIHDSCDGIDPDGIRRL